MIGERATPKSRGRRCGISVVGATAAAARATPRRSIRTTRTQPTTPTRARVYHGAAPGVRRRRRRGRGPAAPPRRAVVRPGGWLGDARPPQSMPPGMTARGRDDRRDVGGYDADAYGRLQSLPLRRRGCATRGGRGAESRGDRRRAHGGSPRRGGQAVPSTSRARASAQGERDVAEFEAAAAAAATAGGSARATERVGGGARGLLSFELDAPDRRRPRGGHRRRRSRSARGGPPPRRRTTAVPPPPPPPEAPEASRRPAPARRRRAAPRRGARAPVVDNAPHRGKPTVVRRGELALVALGRRGFEWRGGRRGPPSRDTPPTRVTRNLQQGPRRRRNPRGRRRPTRSLAANPVSLSAIEIRPRRRLAGTRGRRTRTAARGPRAQGVGARQGPSPSQAQGPQPRQGGKPGQGLDREGTATKRSRTACTRAGAGGRSPGHP